MVGPSDRDDVQDRPEVVLGRLSIAFAAATITQIDLVRVGLAPELTPTIAATSTLFIGCLVGAGVTRVLRARRRSAIITTVSAASLLPAAMWFSATNSTWAFLLASVAFAVTASQLLTAAVAIAARGVAWLTNRYRERGGRPTIQDAMRRVFADLGPDGRSAAALGVVATLFLTMSLFIDTTPADQPGVIGILADVFGRLWSVLRGLSTALLAGAVVLYVREKPLVASIEPTTVDRPRAAEAQLDGVAYTRGANMSLNNIEIDTDRQEFHHASVFAVEVGATGPRGGDAGHGSRCVLAFENLGGTAWEVEVDGQVVADHPDRVVLRFGGDAEGHNLVQALEYAALRLRQSWRH